MELADRLQTDHNIAGTFTSGSFRHCSRYKKNALQAACEKTKSELLHDYFSDPFSFSGTLILRSSQLMDRTASVSESSVRVYVNLS